MKKRISFIILTLVAAMLMGLLSGCSSSRKLTGDDYVHGKTIGVLKNSTAEACAAKAGKLKSYDTSETLVAALKDGEIDCIITDDETADVLMDEHSKLKIYGEPYAVFHFAFAVGKENTDLADKINGALAQLKAEGVIDNITASYISGQDYGYTAPEDIQSTGSKLTIAVASDFAPYSYENSSKKIRGIDVDVAQAVCDLLGVELEVVAAKRGGIIPMVQRGQANFAAGGLLVTEEAMEHVSFTDSYATSKQVIIINK